MGPHNPPSHPELVEFLAQEFQAAGYDQKRLIRWIAASDAYKRTRPHSHCIICRVARFDTYTTLSAWFLVA